MMMNLSISSRAVVRGTQPFFYFEVEDFLPGDFYEALRQSFPPARTCVRQESTKKRMLSPRDDVLRTVIEQRKPWLDLWTFLGSSVFLADCRHLILGALWRARGVRALKHWTLRPSNSRFLRRFESRVGVQLEFSFLEDGASIIPHTDGESKLLSLMLYFPDDADQASLPLGTQFYRPRDANAARQWSNFKSRLILEHERADFENAFEMFYQPAFRPNTLVGFVKNDLSYHALNPITLPTGSYRKSVNINIVAS